MYTHREIDAGLKNQDLRHFFEKHVICLAEFVVGTFSDDEARCIFEILKADEGAKVFLLALRECFRARLEEGVPF